MNFQNLLLSSVIGLTSIFGGISSVEASQRCIIQVGTQQAPFPCEVVDSGPVLTLTMGGKIVILQNKYNLNQYRDQEGNLYIRNGNSLHTSGASIDW